MVPSTSRQRRNRQNKGKKTWQIPHQILLQELHGIKEKTHKEVSVLATHQQAGTNQLVMTDYTSPTKQSRRIYGRESLLIHIVSGYHQPGYQYGHRTV
jgi:hypothetical protein